MTSEEAKDLENGVYRFFWGEQAGGGSSVGVVCRDSVGRVRFHASNWVASVPSDNWTTVRAVKLIRRQSDGPHPLAGNTDLVERMCLEVLKGNMEEAYALKDLLEEHRRERDAPGRVREFAPVRKITVPVDRLRVVVYFPLDHRGHAFDIDTDQVNQLVTGWLAQPQGEMPTPLLVNGADRIEIYELPES